MARMTLDAFTIALTGAAGDNLVSLVLFGSAARGDYDPNASDLNTLLILDDASAVRLRPLAEPVKQWVRAGQPPPLIFSAGGWRRSTDVFAIEIEDMRQAHRVLAGDDPFTQLETAASDLRRELEREARGKLVQLRAEFVAAESDGRALAALLERSAKTFFILFRAAIRLRGGTAPLNHRELVAATAELTGLDPGAFEWVIARLAREQHAKLTAFDPLGERYLAAIEGFVHFVDQLQH